MNLQGSLEVIQVTKLCTKKTDIKMKTLFLKHFRYDKARQGE